MQDTYSLHRSVGQNSLIMLLFLGTFGSASINAEPKVITGHWQFDLAATKAHFKENPNPEIEEKTLQWLSHELTGYDIGRTTLDFVGIVKGQKKRRTMPYEIVVDRKARCYLAIKEYGTIKYTFLSDNKVLFEGGVLVWIAMRKTDEKDQTEKSKDENTLASANTLTTLASKAKQAQQKLINTAWQRTGGSTLLFREVDNELEVVRTTDHRHFEAEIQNILASETGYFFDETDAITITNQSLSITRSDWTHHYDRLPKNKSGALLKSYESRVKYRSAPHYKETRNALWRQARMIFFTCTSTSDATCHDYAAMLKIGLKDTFKNTFLTSRPKPVDFDALTDEQKHDWLTKYSGTIICYPFNLNHKIGSHNNDVVVGFERFKPGYDFGLVLLGSANLEVQPIDKIKTWIKASTGYSYEQWLANPDLKRIAPK